MQSFNSILPPVLHSTTRFPVYDFALTSDATGAASITFEPAAGVFFFINGFELVAVSSGVLLGDVDLSGDITFLDSSPFINILSANGFQLEADIDLDGAVTFLDIQPFIDILANP